jgi:RNA polymerase sigma factor (sigma-70 family)
MAFDDLCNEGLVGLLQAVKHYNPERGGFTPYVRSSVNLSMKRALEYLDKVVRVSSEQQDRLRLINRVERDFLLRWGRRPSLSDLERALPLSREQIGWALASDLRVERPSSRRDDGLTPEQLVPDDPAYWPEALVAAREERERVWEAFEEAGLTDREKTVVRLRFGLGGGDPQSLPNIGRKIGTSRETPRLDLLSAFPKMEVHLGSLHGDP